MSSSAKHLSMAPSLIAPCGMNCGLCIAHLRTKNQCLGCNSTGGYKSQSREQCVIKNCNELIISGGKFCFSCDMFPCRRLLDLDKRYRTKYGMSMIENLRSIEHGGIRKFLAEEKIRWKCDRCGKLVSVHRPECLVCGVPKNAAQSGVWI